MRWRSEKSRAWALATFVTVAAILPWLLTGDPSRSVAPGGVALAVDLLIVRDRLAPRFMAPNRRRDLRAVVVFIVFFVALCAAAELVAVVRAL
jgi:hypothetical protein